MNLFDSSGQRNADGRALARMRADSDFAAVGFDDAADNGEAEAGALLFGGAEQRAEGAAALFLGHAGAGVPEFDQDMGRAETVARQPKSPGENGERTAVGHGFD